MFRMCCDDGAGGNGDSSISGNFDMYSFARHDYEIPYIVYVCYCLLPVII